MPRKQKIKIINGTLEFRDANNVTRWRWRTIELGSAMRVRPFRSDGEMNGWKHERKSEQEGNSRPPASARPPAPVESRSELKRRRGDGVQSRGVPFRYKLGNREGKLAPLSRKAVMPPPPG